ncbi:hypothetical protein XENOCAPTIV_019187 [Xenoophorus captivus]|uniref:EVA1 domain-containing protein n=1 Tax=Xenoophorus captivus TaxID=1517983 RepID=A0ABV0Q3T6_9TELE
MGVSFGLFMALCLLIAGIACKTHRFRRPPPTPEMRQLRESSKDEEEEEESMSEVDGMESGLESESKVTAGPLSERSSPSNGTLRSLNVFTSAEELEKARRLEERERIVREIWRNGQPDILVTGTGTIGRVFNPSSRGRSTHLWVSTKLNEESSSVPKTQMNFSQILSPTHHFLCSSYNPDLLRQSAPDVFYSEPSGVTQSKDPGEGLVSQDFH